MIFHTLGNYSFIPFYSHKKRCNLHIFLNNFFFTFCFADLFCSRLFARLHPNCRQKCEALCVIESSSKMVKFDSTHPVYCDGLPGGDAAVKSAKFITTS